MSRSLLHLVLRHAEGLAAGMEAEPDVELLRRFVRSRDESAFGELLQRHGAMVWAVCRQSLADDADVEDAFQATFLALIRSAGSVRSGHAIAGWLHGVAVRVALKLKRSAARRRRREECAAGDEADRTIPEATWDALLAAVHEEVQRLPAALRTAFVLCELEGVRQPEAAARLGWKSGTLSGRLSRARQLLIERLTNRGLAPALAGGSLVLGVATATAIVPSRLMDKAMSLTGAGEAVSPAILKLVHEVMPMTMLRTKLAAAVLVAGGLGAVLFPLANAQPVPGASGPPPGARPGGSSNFEPPGASESGPPKPGRNSFGPGGGSTGAGIPSSVLPGGGGVGGGSPPGMMGSRGQWEYKFVVASFPAKEFVQLFTDMGNDGWEYCGTAPHEFTREQLAEAQKAHPDRIVVKPGSQTALIFKRPKGGMMRGFGGGGGGGQSFGVSGPMGAPGGGGGPGFPGSPMGAPGGGGGSGFPGGPPPAGLSDSGRPGPPFGASGGYNNKGGSKSSAGAGGATSPGTASAPRQNITVITLKHADANSLSNVLGRVFRNISVTADERTNSLIVNANSDTLDDVKMLIQRLDVPAADEKPAEKPSKPRAPRP
jgi:RNA polymerase sigma factor (sigma-70 family)